MAALSNGNGSGNGHGNGNGHSRAAKADVSGLLADRLPPQNLEAEQGVLGSILLDNDVLHEVIPILKADDFYRDAHQIVYRAIRDLYDLGKAVDAITLADELTRRDEIEAVGGTSSRRGRQQRPARRPTPSITPRSSARSPISRQLIESANEILRDGYSNNFTADQLLEAAERRIFAIAEDQTKGDTAELRDVVQSRRWTGSIARSESRHPITGVATGYFDLDDITGGFQPDQLIILAARPSMGKTALRAEHLRPRRRRPEEGRPVRQPGDGQARTGRAPALRPVPGRRPQAPHRPEPGHPRDDALGKGYDELRIAPLFIDDTPARNMLQITANARRLKMRQNLGMIVVDYIQLVDSEESRDSRQEQIAKISRRLKTLARELQSRSSPSRSSTGPSRTARTAAPGWPTSASRAPSSRTPTSSCSSTGPNTTTPTTSPASPRCIIAKNRNGATGDVKLTFLKNITRFENLANIAEPPIDAGAF